MESKTTIWSKVRPLCLLALLLSSSAAVADDGARFVGRWKGAIIFEKGAIEGDMVAEFVANPGGKLVGLCSLPVHGVTDKPLVDIKWNGNELSFVYKDDTGTSLVTVALSADGRRLSGKMQEKDKSYPIYLKRMSEEELTAKGSLEVLSADNRELRQRFDKDAGKVRLVVLLSPTCSVCIRMARMIQRYLLEEVDDPRLAVYLVWGPMLEGDNQEVAKTMPTHATDRRAVHYWTANADLAKLFSESLKSPSPAWDVLFFFGPGARWTNSPQPADYAHQQGKSLPLDHQFNGEKLVAQVRKLLPAKQAPK